MDPSDLDDDDAQALAKQIGPHLDPGSYGDRVVLTKRQFIAAASGVAGAGALATWGVDEATAQAAGSQGTESSPNNMYAYDLNVANAVTSSLPMDGHDIEDAGSVSAEQTKINQLVGVLGWETQTDNQSVPDSTDTKVEWYVNELEDDQIVNTDLSNNEITVLESGTYSIKSDPAFLEGSGWSTGDRVYSMIYVNGTVVKRSETPKVGTAGQHIPVNYVLELDANDTVAIYVHQRSGGEKFLWQTSSVATKRSKFVVSRLG